VGNDFIIYFNSALTTVFFNALSAVGGNFYIDSNTALTTVRFPALTTVASQFYIGSNEALTTVFFNALSAVRGSFNIWGTNEALTFASFPLVTYVGANVQICENGPSFIYPTNVAHASKTNKCTIAQGSGGCPSSPSTCP